MDITLDTSKPLTTARQDLHSTRTTTIAAPNTAGERSPIDLDLATLSLVVAPPGPLSVLDTAFPGGISSS